MINDLLFILADVEIFGSDFFDKKDFIELLVRSAFNFLIVGYIVRYLYYPATKNKDYLFTYLLISVTVFFLCFLLENVKLELGFALGLFAIFRLHGNEQRGWPSHFTSGRALQPQVGLTRNSACILDVLRRSGRRRDIKFSRGDFS